MVLIAEVRRHLMFVTMSPRVCAGDESCKQNGNNQAVPCAKSRHVLSCDGRCANILIDGRPCEGCPHP